MSSVPIADVFRLPFSKASIGNRFGIKGPFYGPQGHRGLDFVQPGGTGIPVIANGIVTRVMWSDVLGRVTIVKHVRANGSVIYSGYCHQSVQSVKVGQIVKIGKIIGKVGTTGSASSGNHLHMTISKEALGTIYGDVQDPLAYIEAHDTKVSTPATATSTAKYTTAKSGEGLGAIATRVKISLSAIKKLNPTIKAPDFLVKLGQKIRIK